MKKLKLVYLTHELQIGWCFFLNVSKIMLYHVIVFLLVLFWLFFLVSLFYQLKFWISNLQIIVWSSKWFHLKKSSITKLYNLSRFITFILAISSSDKVICKIVHKMYISYIVFTKLYKRCTFYEQSYKSLCRMKKWLK